MKSKLPLKAHFSPILFRAWRALTRSSFFLSNFKLGGLPTEIFNLLNLMFQIMF